MSLLQRAELLGVEHTSTKKIVGIADVTYSRERGSKRCSHTCYCFKIILHVKVTLWRRILLKLVAIWLMKNIICRTGKLLPRMQNPTFGFCPE
jgi:hypothetical protein